MRAPAFLLVILLPVLAGAQEWVVSMKAVNGKASYSCSRKSPAGEQAGYSGKAKVRGPGRRAEAIFNTYLNEPRDGVFRLDYQAEVSWGNRVRPPFQASGKVLLVPGRPVIAAEAGGWKLILELEGEPEGKPPKARMGTLEAKLRCGRKSYPVSFLYLPEEQYSAVLYEEKDEEVGRFMVGLLPNFPSAGGEFKLQYTLQLKDGRDMLSSESGELILKPGGKKRRAAAGKRCVFYARALR